MKGHVIAFESPIPKIYNKLPPPAEDLDEVLAILFTGPELPTTADFQRTPLLVRRKVVKKALEWLKLNHKDYHDLTIDYKAIEALSEDMPPVSVQYKKMNSNTSTESMSVFEQEDEEGVKDGPCPFAVHGLTSTNLEVLSNEELKFKALEHLHTGAPVLSVTHGTKPISIFKNTSLYPQIF
ncbi:hypothetical protein BDN72DRAFT_776075, partial [Pluteus cervinus]